MHHEWYVSYHLMLVERITNELLDLHPEADFALARALVWLHDIGKTEPSSDVHLQTRVVARRLLQEIGFGEAFQQRIDENLERIDRKENLVSAPIEVQIVS